MHSDADKLQTDPIPNAIDAALDGLRSGQTSVAQVRKYIGELLTENAGPAPAIQNTLHEEFQHGRIDKQIYDALISEIERYISEEAPTEWSIEKNSGNGAELAPPTLLDEHPTNPQSPPEAEADGEVGDPPDILEPGATLRDRFVLVSRIDGGSMGEIYKAVDLRRKEAGAKEPWVAIKIISREFARYPDALRALQKEATSAQRLAHPNILRVFDFDRHGDHFYITMELLEGESLVRLLDRQRFAASFPLGQGLRIIEDVAAGLSHAHSRGVIHADVKPGNVFVTRDERAKLLDFGIARAAGDANDDSASSIIGAHTPAYASCEVLEGEEPTFQDDLFSLGCLAYRILAGRRAFGQSTALQAEANGVEPEPISELSPGQWEALRRALAFRRAERTADVADFIDALLRPAAAMPELDMPVVEEPASELWNVFQRPRAALWVGGACVLALGIWLLQMGPSSTSDRPAASVAGTELADQESAVRSSDPAAVGPSPEELVARPPSPAPAQAGVKDSRTTEDDGLASKVQTLARSANERMDRGSLTKPENRSAKYYLQEMRRLDANAAETTAVADRLTGLMMMKAALAVSAGDFREGERWLAEAEDLGAAEEVVAAVRADISDARATAAARERSRAAAAAAQPPVAREPARTAESRTAPAAATPPAATGVPADDQVEQTEASVARTASDSLPDAERAAAVAAAATPTTPDPAAGSAEAPPAAETAQSAPAVVEPKPATQTAGGSTDQTETEPDAAPSPSEAVTESPADDIALVALSELEFSKFIEPSYPKRLANRGKSGWVSVIFRVDLFGNPRDIEVVGSEPPGLFETAAVRAVEKWRFEPELEDGLPVERRTQVKLVFEQG